MIPAKTPARCVIVVPRLQTGGGNALRREHPMVSRKRIQRERAAVMGALQLYQFRGGFNHLPALPAHCHLVRVSPGHRPIDPGNLAGYFKAVQDQIAWLYGVDDDATSPLQFSYAQERGTAHLVRIEIEARETKTPSHDGLGANEAGGKR